MSLKQYIAGLAVLAVAGLVGGAAATGLSPSSVASAQSDALPAIFHAGADLLSPMGPVEVLEIQGQWIRIKSLHALVTNDSENQWLYVPAMAGTWIPGDSALAGQSR